MMNERQQEAAQWLAGQQAGSMKDLVPTLMNMFQLTTYEAVQVVIEANLLRAKAMSKEASRNG